MVPSWSHPQICPAVGGKEQIRAVGIEAKVYRIPSLLTEQKSEAVHGSRTFSSKSCEACRRLSCVPKSRQ